MKFLLLQARNPEWVGRPFFARFDARATWLDELRPAFGEKAFFFEKELERVRPVPVGPVWLDEDESEETAVA